MKPLSVAALHQHPVHRRADDPDVLGAATAVILRIARGNGTEGAIS